jgi:hypothetical protein
MSSVVSSSPPVSSCPCSCVIGGAATWTLALKSASQSDPLPSSLESSNQPIFVVTVVAESFLFVVIVVIVVVVMLRLVPALEVGALAVLPVLSSLSLLTFAFILRRLLLA